MQIGIGVGGASIGQAVDQVRAAAADGFASAWFSNIFGVDALTASAVAGAAVDGIELGTFVVPAQPRHPFAMAQQAASAHDACDGRLTLGIGLSHQVVIESMLGLPWERNATFMREYLSVLVPLLREGAVSFQGEVLRVSATLERRLTDGPRVIVAALGPRMLQLTGELADGTALWMTGPRTVADHIVPTITKAAESAGRPAPQVVMGLPVCVTADPDAARQRAAQEFAVYGQLPSYRAMLDREQAGGPADVAIVGDEDTVRGAVAGLADVGVTTFNAAVFGEKDDARRTRALLKEMAAG